MSIQKALKAAGWRIGDLYMDYDTGGPFSCRPCPACGQFDSFVRLRPHKEGGIPLDPCHPGRRIPIHRPKYMKAVTCIICGSVYDDDGPDGDFEYAHRRAITERRTGAFRPRIQ